MSVTYSNSSVDFFSFNDYSPYIFVLVGYHICVILCTRGTPPAGFPNASPVGADEAASDQLWSSIWRGEHLVNSGQAPGEVSIRSTVAKHL